MSNSALGDARLREHLRAACASPHDGAAVSAAVRDLLRRGLPVPPDLLALRPTLPPRDLDLDLPLRVHVELPDGREQEVGTTPCPGGVRLPPHAAWWVEPWAPVEPCELAEAVVGHRLAGVHVSGLDAREALAATLRAAPSELRRVGVDWPYGAPDPGEVRPTPGLPLEALASLPSLDTLHVRWPGLTDAGLSAIGACVGLRELSLAAGGVTDDGLARALPRLPALRRLALEALDAFEGRGLEPLEPGAVERIAVRSCPAVRDEHLPRLGRAGRLRSLDLSGTGVGGRCLGGLPRDALLASLDLDACERLRDEALHALVDLPCLESLRIGAGRLGDPALDIIGGLPALRRLYVTAPWADTAVARLGSAALDALTLRTPGARPVALAQALRRSPSLRSLRLEAPLTADVVDAITSLEALEELELHVPDVSASLRGLRRLGRLRWLRLTGHVADEDLRSLARAPDGLRRLELDVTRVSAAGLAVLAELPRLSALRLRVERWMDCGCCFPGFRGEEPITRLIAALPDCDVQVVSGALG